MGSQNHIYSKKKLIKLKQGQSNTGRRLQLGRNPVMSGNRRGKRWDAGGRGGTWCRGWGCWGGLWDADRAQGAGKKPNDVLIAFGAAGVRCGEQTLQTSAAPSFWSPTAQGYECCKCWLQSNPTAVPNLFFGGGGRCRRKRLLSYCCSTAVLARKPIPSLPSHLPTPHP